jgi:hypothetical protein
MGRSMPMQGWFPGLRVTSFQTSRQAVVAVRAGFDLALPRGGGGNGHSQTRTYQATELNSGTKTFPVQAHLNPKPMQVNVGDPHKQAKEMSAAHTCGVRGVTKRAGK